VKRAAVISVLGVAAILAQGPRQLKPGFNLFSKEQDIQLGKEAAAQVEREMTLANDPALNEYIQRIGAKLAATPEAGGFPYTFRVVSDKSINAFALPGGPTFVNTGLLTAAGNEAQLAGVMAHEISHVALRHGTNQASKANLIQLPAVLAGSMGGGGMAGSLAQLGIGVGAGSVLMKFSRNAERDADLLGTRIMAKAGYNPVEMARFFEKLKGDAGSRGLQFFSDHPDPGNRVQAVEAEIRYLRPGTYSTGDASQFARMQKIVAGLPAPPPRPAQTAAGKAPQVRPSATLREYRGDTFTISHPDNWRASMNQASRAWELTITPAEGVVKSGSESAIGIGAIVSVAPAASGDLRRDTDALVKQLASSNSGMTVRNTKDYTVDGQPALYTTLQSRSPFAQETELDYLITVKRPEGLFHVILIAPESGLGTLQPAFDSMARSLRFAR
jgi:beta-barrel assembly-enhancing protease